MKIAVSASGRDLDAHIDQRFGRCEYFLIIDTDTMEAQAFPNENKNQTSGAGIQAASFVISKGAKAVLTGNCGPKVMNVFRAEGIHVYTGQAGGIRQAIQALKKGAISESATLADNRQGTFVPPVGRGRGGGRGGGRGMGGGYGRRTP